MALLQLFYTVAYLAIFCGCTAQFVSDLDGNPKDWFSHKEAHLLQLCMKILDAERFFFCKFTAFCIAKLFVNHTLNDKGMCLLVFPPIAFCIYRIMIQKYTAH